MNAPPVVCSVHDTLSAAAQKMWDHDCGAIPVVDDQGRITGIVTDRDICMAAYTQGRALDAIPVTTAMARQVFSCYADDRVEEAEAVMAEKQVRRLPVIDDDRQPIGMLSLGDIARATERKSKTKNGTNVQLSHTLATICAPRIISPHRHG
jgi:CBS domain-containing protein